MKYPSIRIVFNRSNNASKERATSVYVEVVYLQKKRYIPTGVKVKLGEFDQKKNIVVRRNDMLILNQTISTVFNRIQRYIFDLQQEEKEFTFEAFDAEIKGTGNKDNFIDYLKKAIEERSDLEPTTKKQQLVVVKKLEAFGKIKGFNTVTEPNIRAFDKWLHDVDMKGLSQVSIHNVHKRLKPYVREAKRLKMIKDNPYDYIKIERGKNKMIRYLTSDELKSIESATFESERIARARDLFVFSCYTGLAYADMARFDASKLQRVEDYVVYSSTRKKTASNFVIIMFPEALAILSKYNNKLPVISNQKLNLYLKIVSVTAGISKDLTSHMARHTFATTVMLANNVPLHITQKALGHERIATTELYAKVMDQNVIAEMGKLHTRLQEGL